MKTNCGLVHVTANLLFHVLSTVLHVFYRLARFNSSSRRYFNFSPILQAGCNYSLCSPNQTLTGWGMTSHWDATKLKLIHKNSTYPRYPPKTEILPVGTHLLLTSSSVFTTISINSQLYHGPKDQTCSWVHVSELTFSGPVTTALVLPIPCCLDLFVPTITTEFYTCIQYISIIFTSSYLLSFCCEHICQFYMEASPQTTLPKVAAVPNSPVASSY